MNYEADKYFECKKLDATQIGQKILYSLKNTFNGLFSLIIKNCLSVDSLFVNFIYS